MKCLNHKDKEAIANCQKFELSYCEECLQCVTPKAYCKFRTQCLIWNGKDYDFSQEHSKKMNV